MIGIVKDIGRRARRDAAQLRARYYSGSRGLCLETRSQRLSFESRQRVSHDADRDSLREIRQSA